MSKIRASSPRLDMLRPAVLLVLLGLTQYPFIILRITSLKSNDQFYHSIWNLGFPLHPENYALAWQALCGHMWNSVVITTLSVVGTVLLSLLSAQALARHQFYGPMAAGYVITGLPLLLLFAVCSRQFIHGLTSGALKA